VPGSGVFTPGEEKLPKLPKTSGKNGMDKMCEDSLAKSQAAKKALTGKGLKCYRFLWEIC